MIRRRSIWAGALALFLVLAGTEASHALWSTQTSSTFTASAGGVAVAQTGFDQMAFQYASGALTETSRVTVTNTGTVAATYTATLSAPTATIAPASTLAAAIVVDSWVSGASCTTTQGAVTSRTWANGSTLTGTLAAGASAVYCIRTTLTTAKLAANDGASLTGQLTLSSAVGASAWKSAPSTLTVIQSVADTLAPTAPGTPVLASPATTDSGTSFSWAASTDASGVTGYDVYRGTVLVSAGQPATSFTDTGLSVGTKYMYTVKARDAAAHVSAASGAYTVTTSAQPDPLKWYRVSNPLTGLCVTASAIPLLSDDCASSSYWQYTPNGSFKKVVDWTSRSVWANSKSNGANGIPQLSADTNTTTNVAQQWTVGALTTTGAGTYRFTNAAKGDCLALTSATPGAALAFGTCSTSAAQSFTLTAVTPQ